MLSMFIVFIWAPCGRKICANSVQACIVCKSCAKPEVAADSVQRLCKLCEWNPRRALPQRPQQPLWMHRAHRRKIGFVEGQQQGVLVNVQEMFVGSHQQGEISTSDV